MIVHDNIEEIVAILQQGGLILYPTDTIWGIGCNALNVDSIDKIYRIKNRSKLKPLIVLVDGIQMLKRFVKDIHPRVETLLSFHAKPLTIIYDQPAGLPISLLGQSGSIAIRIIKDSFCQSIIKSLGCPLVSTSANISGAPFPNHFGEISSEIIQQMDYVVKYKQDIKESGSPSVVASYDKKGELIFIRD
jgi:L-threonylcarbamoyladenylate synthase